METILDSKEISKYLSRENLGSYKKDFEAWVAQFDMTDHLGPADHFALKVEDEAAFEKLVEAFKPYCLER